MDSPSLARTPVAMVGLGAVSAAGDDVQAMLAAVASGRSALCDCTQYRDGPYMTSRLGAIPPRTWNRLRASRSQAGASDVFLVAHQALTEAVRHAGSQLSHIDAARVGLVLSSTKADVTALAACLSDEGAATYADPHILASGLASDLARAHDVAGPVQCVSVACISGLLAIQQGARLILADKADAVLVVGVDLLSHFVVAGFSTLRSLDPHGCRPFDKNREGLTLGEGAGAVVLMRATKTSEPLATIGGWGVSNDANHLTGPSRDGSGLALAVERALRMAGLDPRDIECVGAHGTGTVYNDRMEALALQTVFGEAMPPVSSCKGTLGHTLGAAGVLECVLHVQAARVNLMPGTAGFITPDPEAPANVTAAPRSAQSYRRILKTNSGFGGTNSAVVLEVIPSHE